MLIYFVSKNATRKKDYTFHYYYVNIKSTKHINLSYSYYVMLNTSNRFLILIK